MATNTGDSGNKGYLSGQKVPGPRGKKDVIHDLAGTIGLRRHELIEYARMAAERADLEDENRFSLTDYREVLEQKENEASTEAIKRVLSSSAQLSDNFGGMYHHGESPDSIYFSYEGDFSYRG